MLSHDETIAALEANDPPVSPGSRWRITEDDGTVVLELRVLCRYPDHYPDGEIAFSNNSRLVITERCGGTQRREERFEIGRLPEYNLRRLFEPVKTD